MDAANAPAAKIQRLDDTSVIDDADKDAGPSNPQPMMACPKGCGSSFPASLPPHQWENHYNSKVCQERRPKPKAQDLFKFAHDTEPQAPQALPAAAVGAQQDAEVYDFVSSEHSDGDAEGDMTSAGAVAGSLSAGASQPTPGATTPHVHLEMAERRASGASAEEEEGDRLAASKLGITLRGLRKLRDLLIEVYGDDFYEMSTAEVNSRWVQVVTLPRRCRLLEDERMVDPRDVKPPQYFISHAWKNRASRLFDYVLTYLQDASDDVTVWLDIFAVNQHEGTAAQAWDVNPLTFRRTVETCSAGMIVVLDRERCSPASRAWCIFEWANSLSMHGPDGFHMHLKPEDRAAVFSSIDVERAESFKQEDKETILGEVVRQYGSPEAFNNKLKLQIMLEPLSYRIDLRRLMAPAEAAGAEWRLGPVREWLASGRRVLVVAGGAGEGKSTLSAALATLPEMRGAVTAHHFIKYSDSRRLDPVRVIKSLAFQLAERIPAFCSAILQLTVARVAQLLDMEAAFEELVLRPLQDLEAKWRQRWLALEAGGSAADGDDPWVTDPVMVLIDALDEADPLEQQLQVAGCGGAGSGVCPLACGNTALQLITSHLQKLPPYVRFVFTTRPTAATGQVLPCLKRTFGRDEVLLLKPAELRASRAEDGGGGAAAAVTGSAGSGGGGVMVYHTVVAATALTAGSEDGAAAAAAAAASSANTSRRASPSSTDTGGRGAPPDTSGRPPHQQDTLIRHVTGHIPQQADVYRLFGRIFERSYQHLAAAAAAAAPPPPPPPPRPPSAIQSQGEQEQQDKQHQQHQQLQLPPLDMVRDLVACVVAAREPLSESFINQLGLGPAIELLPGYPVLFFVEEHHLYMVHKSLGDWLLDPHKSGAFAAEVHLGHSLIGLHLARAWQQRRSINSSNSDYTLRYLFAHLVAAAQAQERSACAATGPAAPPPRQRQLADEAAAQLDVLLADFELLQAVLEAGHGPALISALGGLTALTHTRLSYDAFRWLRANLFDLQRLKRSDQLPAHALRSAPLHTELHRVAVAAASQEWRTGGVLPASQGVWPACEAVLKGHTNYVNNVAFSPDGRQCASASHDKTVRIYDTATGRCRAQLEGHSSFVRSVAYRPPDGRQLASTGGDETVRLWDAATGQCVAVLEGHTSYGTSVCFTADGTTLVSGSGDRTLRVWDLATGTCTGLLRGHTDSIRCVTVNAWRTTAGGDDGDGGSDSALLVGSGSRDGTARIWRLAALGATGEGGGGAGSGGECVAVLEGHAGNVAAVVFSPAQRGRLVVTGAGDKLVRVWDRRAGYRCVATLQGHTSNVSSLAFLPCPAADNAAGEAGEAAGPSTGTGTGAGAGAKQTTEAWQDQCAGAGASDLTGQRLLIASGADDNSIRLWELDADGGGSGAVAVLLGHRGCVRGVAVSADGRLIASASWDGSVRLWDRAAAVQNAAGADAVQDHAASVTSLAATPDGVRLVSGNGDGSVNIWDADPITSDPAGAGGASGSSTSSSGRRRRLTARLLGHSNAVNAVAVSPDGRRCASGSHDNTVRLWALDAGACLAVMKGHTDYVTTVAFSPDGARVASGSHDEVARLWDAAAPSETCLAELRGHKNSVRCVAFASPSSPDGGSGAAATAGGGGGGSSVVVSGSWDGSVRLWSVAGQDGSCLAVLEGHKNYVVTLAVYDDTLVSGSWDGTARVWHLPTRSCRAELAMPGALCTCIAISRDGRHVFTAGSDRAIHVWDAATAAGGAAAATPVAEWPTAHDAAITALLPLGPEDSCQLVSGSLDDSMRVWDVGAGAGADGAGRCTAVLLGGTRNISSAAQTPDGAALIHGSWDGSVRVYDMAPERVSGGGGGQMQLHCVLRHGSYVSGVAAAATAALAAVAAAAAAPPPLPYTSGGDGGAAATNISVSGSWDGSVKVWDLRTADLLATLCGHAGGVVNVALAPGGLMAVSGSWDGTARVWDLRGVTNANRSGTPAGGPGGGGGGGGESSGGACVATLSGHAGTVTSVAVSPDGRLVATGCSDGTVRLWRAGDWECMGTLRAHEGSHVTCVAFSPAAADGGGGAGLAPLAAAAAVAGAGAVAKGRAVAAGNRGRRVVGQLQGGAGSLLLATGGGDGAVRVWEVESGACVAALGGAASSTAGGEDGGGGGGGCGDDAAGLCAPVWCVAFSPDGRLLAAGGGDALVRLWELSTGACGAVLRGHSGPVTSVLFSAGGGAGGGCGGGHQGLISSSDDNSVRFWERAKAAC